MTVPRFTNFTALCVTTASLLGAVLGGARPWATCCMNTPAMRVITPSRTFYRVRATKNV